MSLTTGHGPLSSRPAGRFDPPVPRGTTYVEPLLRRVRGVNGEHVVVDSSATLLVHRPDRPPTYAFPRRDVGDVSAVDEPTAPGFVAVAWDDVGAWWEEDEQVFGHPRNPYHRVDCVRADRRLRVAVDGQTVVDTTDVVAVFETALEPRLYVARHHVRGASVAASATTSYCPYKGTATYWNVDVAGHPIDDAAWSYEEPRPESAAIAGLLAFDAARCHVFEAVLTVPSDKEST